MSIKLPITCRNSYAYTPEYRNVAKKFDSIYRIKDYLEFEYGATRSSWHIEFPDEESLARFLLKWS